MYGYPPNPGYPNYGYPQNPGYNTTPSPNYGQPYNTTPNYGYTNTSYQTQPQITGWYSYYFNMISQIEFANLRAWFDSVDLDKSGSIEAHELANLSFDGIPLGYPCAARLIKVFDKDRNGTIDFWEYCTLHKFIVTIRNAFLVADADRSGRLQAQEITTALQQSGFNYLSYNTIVEYLFKYDPQKIGLAWQDFLMLASQIAHTRSIFEWNDTNKDGLVTFNLDQLNQIVAYLS